MFRKASFYAFCGRRSGNNDFQQGQHQQRIAGSDQIVGHDAEAIFDVVVKIAGGLRFGDVEETEKDKRRQLPQPVGGGHQEDQPEGDDFVPDDAAVIRVAERLAGLVDEPDAAQIARSEQEQQGTIGEIGLEENETGPGEQGAECAGCPRCQATAAATGEEVCRMGKQEAQARRFGGQSDRSPCVKIRPACRPGQTP